MRLHITLCYRNDFNAVISPHERILKYMFLQAILCLQFIMLRKLKYDLKFKYVGSVM